MSRGAAVVADRGDFVPLRRSRRAAFRRLARRQPVALTCLAILLAITIAAITAPLVAPYSATEQNLRDSLVGPSSSHWLGTDQLGRDQFSRVLYGGRVSLTVGFGVMLIGGALAAVGGGLSGYTGGWVDACIQRVVDAFLAVPSLLLLLTVMGVVDRTVINITLTIGLVLGVGASRTVRSAVIAIRARSFIEAAHASGVGPLRIFFLHVMPNAASIVIVTATIQFAAAILIEAALSFLGYGVAPPTPAWGGMLGGDSRSFLITAPWLALAPGLAISLVVLTSSILGDGLRDELDPRLSQRNNLRPGPDQP